MHSEKCFLEKIIGESCHLTYIRLLKNRKSARKSRKRRKVEILSLKDEIQLLKEENQRLKRALNEKNKETKDGSNTKK
jgi:cell shape-determining protein MreC